MKTKTPLFKELSNEALLREYASYRELSYNAAQVKSPRLGSLLRSLDIIVALGRKRGLTFPTPFGDKQ